MQPVVEGPVPLSCFEGAFLRVLPWRCSTCCIENVEVYLNKKPIEWAPWTPIGEVHLRSNPQVNHSGIMILITLRKLSLGGISLGRATASPARRTSVGEEMEWRTDVSVVHIMCCGSARPPERFTTTSSSSAADHLRVAVEPLTWGPTHKKEGQRKEWSVPIYNI